MPNINNLNLSEEELPLDFATMPSVGTSRPVPQPGIYRFRLPEVPAIENVLDTDETPDGQVLLARFQDDAMLFNETTNEWYSARISNRFRTVKRRNAETGETEERLVSDFGSLLKAVNSTPEIVTNKSMAQALVDAAGRHFIAEHTLTANCSPVRDIYREGKVIVGKKGCGARYAVTKWGKTLPIPRNEDGTVATRFECQCGAELRAWGQLQGFKSA